MASAIVPVPVEDWGSNWSAAAPETYSLSPRSCCAGGGGPEGKVRGDRPHALGGCAFSFAIEAEFAALVSSQDPKSAITPRIECLSRQDSEVDGCLGVEGPSFQDGQGLEAHLGRGEENSDEEPPSPTPCMKGQSLINGLQKSFYLSPLYRRSDHQPIFPIEDEFAALTASQALRESGPGLGEAESDWKMRVLREKLRCIARQQQREDSFAWAPDIGRSRTASTQDVPSVPSRDVELWPSNLEEKMAVAAKMVLDATESCSRGSYSSAASGCDAATPTTDFSEGRSAPPASDPFFSFWAD